MKTKQANSWGDRTRCKKHNQASDNCLGKKRIEKKYLIGKGSVTKPIGIISRPLEYIKHWKEGWNKNDKQM